MPTDKMICKKIGDVSICWNFAARDIEIYITLPTGVVRACNVINCPPEILKDIMGQMSDKILERQ